jgi:hypothetical protein
MSKTRPDFKRMLVRLPHSRQDYAAVAMTAELAALLGLDLVGTFFDESSLLRFAELPTTREFRAGGWHPLDTNQLTRELAFAAREAERLFDEAIGRHRPKASFAVEEGSPAKLISSAAGDADIIAIIEPKDPIERATHQFNELVAAAFRSTSSILLVPPVVRRFSGPVVVVAADADDPSLTMALAIAVSARERIVIVPSQDASPAASMMARAEAAGVLATLAPPALSGPTQPLPPPAGGRLLVMRRQQDGRAISFLPPHQMPVLLLCSSD